MELDHELLDVFRAESEENLATMTDALIALEARPADAEALQLVFRMCHTLKGNAATLGFDRMSRLAHSAEDLLARLRARELEVTADRITVLLASVDGLRALLGAALGGSPEEDAAVVDLERRLRVALSEGPPGVGTQQHTAPASPATAERPPPAAVAESRRGTLRVDVERLDRLLDLTGEIMIARGHLDQLLREAGARGLDFREVHRESDRVYDELQDLVMKMRMVPIGPTLKQSARTVRDLAVALGKEARLVIEGEDAELDNAVVESVRDLLTHLVRNAMDHGLETPEVRAAAGKPRCGTIALRARHDGGGIEIEIEDDGAGLKRDRIAERARSLGMASEPEKLADADLFRLIFEPGFSTASAITEISGRGVGLDAVRRGIESLRGSVTVQSRPEQGTTITIRLPLTLALIAGFAVEVDGQIYMFPLDSVVECGEGPHDAAESRGVLALRDQPLPYAQLREVLGLPSAAVPREGLVVVSHGGTRAGFTVDALHGETQIVVKPLGAALDGGSMFSGSAILPSGRVALILDVAALLRAAIDSHERGSSAAA